MLPCGEWAGSPSAEGARGAELIASAGCGMCHDIPGIAGADGLVGPPIEHMANSLYVAGVLRNTRQNLSHWIAHAQKGIPGNAMPEMDIIREEARMMAAYLGTLR